MVGCRRLKSPLLLLAVLLAATATAQQYSVVGGTVFRNSGLALPEAEITLEIAPPDATAAPGKSKSKVKKLKAVSSARGEFTFRVPPVAARYRVAVIAKGYQPAEKFVEIQGAAERVDATFSLEPESKH